jgi:hypothetical protein
VSKDCGDESLYVAAGAFGACQFVLHCLSAFSTRNPQMYLMHGIAFLYDLFILAIVAAILQVLRQYLLKHRLQAWKGTINAVTIAFLFIVGLTLTIYPLLLMEFLGFPVNVFAVDIGITGFFLTNVLGSRGILVMAASGIFALVCLRCLHRIRLPRRRLLFWILVVTCLSGIVFSLARCKFISTQPNPLIYSMQETLKDWFIRGKRVVPRPARAIVSEKETAIRLEPSPLDAIDTFRYNHIVILVMETVTESHFAKNFIERKDGFYAKMKDCAAYFDHYYTTNLDSYTSLIAMLTSVQVPYRAYDAPGYFTSVNQAPNMIGALSGKDWKSIFVCTAEYQPFVPMPAFWNSTVHGRDLPNNNNWASLGMNPVEAATEDKAAIPSIVAFVKANQRSIVMHEMVFGHSPRWTALTGKKQFEYYDEFFQELYGNLLEAGLAEKTLFVIVADHGERTDCTVAENYHVPLLIVGKGIKPSTNNGMFSHLDLQRIIGHYISDLPMPEARDDVLVVGHSGRWGYGLITRGGNSMFIDALDGVVLSKKGDLVPRTVFDRFQHAIDYFSRYQQAH